MEVILLERIRSLGKVGDQVNVKPGYARNYLVPSKKAVLATKANIAEFEAKRAELEKKAQGLLDEARERAKAFENLALKISRKAAEDGKLFGSVTLLDVLEAFTAQGITLDKRELTMPEAHIRSVGEYDLAIELHSDVTCSVKLLVEAE